MLYVVTSSLLCPLLYPRPPTSPLPLFSPLPLSFLPPLSSPPPLTFPLSSSSFPPPSSNPLPPLLQHYSVVDASEGQVFIAVYHSFNNTNLYLSEEQGLNYSLSLEYIISPPESDWINGYPAFDVHVVSVCV